MSSLSPIVFSKEIIVSSEHLDDLNHVNNVRYLQWVQDIATEHWNSVTEDSINDLYYWLVLDHEISYRVQAFLDETVTVKTFIEKNDGIRSVRVVQFILKERLIVQAKTTWCLMNKEKHRPARIPEEFTPLSFSK